MSFNEMNTIENALQDHLCGRQSNEGGRMNEVREDTAPYDSSFTLHPSSFRWKYIHGENLILHGKQSQDVFVDTWLKDALCRLNKPLAANPDLADEVIHRLRGVLLEAGYSG